MEQRLSAPRSQRQWPPLLPSDFPQAQWELNQVFEDDVLYLEWKATGGGRKVEDGIDTFIFEEGMIRVQTVVYHVQDARSVCGGHRPPSLPRVTTQHSAHGRSDHSDADPVA